jgi:hypothetical protein
MLLHTADEGWGCDVTASVLCFSEGVCTTNCSSGLCGSVYVVRWVVLLCWLTAPLQGALVHAHVTRLVLTRCIAHGIAGVFWLLYESLWKAKVAGARDYHVTVTISKCGALLASMDHPGAPAPALPTF